MARDLVFMGMAKQYTCAQCCVSMVTYCSLQDALDALDLEGGSSFKNMTGALMRLKVRSDIAPRPCGRPPLNVRRAIVEIKSKSQPKFSYFCVWSANSWYDPYKGYSELTYHHEWKRDFYPNRFIEIYDVK